jgi:hypothetical protein
MPPVPLLVLPLPLLVAPLPPVPVPLLVVPVPPMPPSFATHAPASQAPPEHGAPSALAGFEHWPVVPSQVPTSWHSSIAVHVTGVPAQVPAVQLSAVVHRSASSQAVPSAFAGVEHWPVVVSHVPWSWH